VTLKVFYDDRQTVKNNPSFSPSAGKPAVVVEEWQRRGYDFSIEPVTPVSRDDFVLVHDRKHVNEILDCKRVNGFNNKSPEVAASLHWTTGSLLSAAEHALTSGVNTCSPTSGFHHAQSWQVAGFCTFNGLMVTAMKLLDRLPANQKFGILDIDMHYGDGTAQIIKCHKVEHVRHYTFGGAEPLSEFWKGGPAADEWVAKLPGIVEAFADCAVVIYQAGADPHMEDPFGGALTNEQLRERDRIVFTTLKRLGVPVAWNLAGGYQQPLQKVLDIHNATMEECLKVMA
jgi:acetoin utilization deacetylase AcuC-like enzyme